MNKYKVIVCPETKHKVLQLLQDNGQWLCLHHSNGLYALFSDELEAEAFETAGAQFPQGDELDGLPND